MEFEIIERPIDEPDFPSFWKDREGDLWFWADNRNGVCLSSPSFHCDNDYSIVDFDEFEKDWEFVRVYGVITITV